MRNRTRPNLAVYMKKMSNSYWGWRYWWCWRPWWDPWRLYI